MIAVAVGPNTSRQSVRYTYCLAPVAALSLLTASDFDLVKTMGALSQGVCQQAR